MSAPAGWYSDPTRPQTQRYWDGASWSDHVAPASPARTGPGMLVWVVTAGILIAVLAVAGVVWMAGANDGVDCAIENSDRAIDGRPQIACPE